MGSCLHFPYNSQRLHRRTERFRCAIAICYVLCLLQYCFFFLFDRIFKLRTLKIPKFLGHGGTTPKKKIERNGIFCDIIALQTGTF